MKFLSKISLACALLSILFAFGNTMDTEELLRIAFDSWEEKYGKSYESLEQRSERFSIWRENFGKVMKNHEQYARGLVTYKLGMNAFADMTFGEFQAIYLPYTRVVRLNQNKIPSRVSTRNLPDEKDWVKEGYVTSIDDQGQCGSCYTFSTAGTIEGQYFNMTKNLTKFSKKQFVDCSSDFGNLGCSGGLMTNCYKYAQQNGLETEADYPYHPSESHCQASQTKAVIEVKRFTEIEQSEESLQEAVATVGPIAVAIDAEQHFQLYESGVFYDSDCSSERLDHAVLAVGYGSEETANGTTEYWLVKNSWGTNWGEKGYIKMARNRDNNCGIATMASYPELRIL